MGFIACYEVAGFNSGFVYLLNLVGEQGENENLQKDKLLRFLKNKRPIEHWFENALCWKS